MIAQSSARPYWNFLHPSTMRPIRPCQSSIRNSTSPPTRLGSIGTNHHPEEQPLPWLQNTILLLTESRIVLHHLPRDKSESPSRTVNGAGLGVCWFHFCFGIMVRKSLRLPLPERLLLNCGLLSACSSLSGSHVETYLSWYRRGENPSFAKNLSSLANNSPSMPTK